MNDVMNAILSRRSTRVFAEGKIKESDLDQILLAGQYAPSAMNSQPWHFTIVENMELISEIGEESKAIARGLDNDYLKKIGENENFKPFYNPDVVIFISGNKHQFTASEDCAIAAQNMLLAAESLGIGSVYLGFPKLAFNGNKKEEFISRLEIPKDYEVHVAISFGYKKVETMN